MPVSRKRKKSPKSAAALRAGRRRLHTERVRLMNSLGEIASGREEGLARRIELARPHAADLAARLTASPKTGTALEDELCAHLGPLLADLGSRPADGGYVGPDHLAAALIDALSGDGTAAAERVLRALTAILPAPLRDGTRVTAPEPATAGEVLWSRDRYGSRFAVVAPFVTPEGPVRWYLWDIDACHLMPLPVHAGFYASPEEALAAWQVGVGAVAAGGTSWHRIDDSGLLAALLPKPEEWGTLGGESAGQFAEYHRCRRLAEAIRDLPRVLSLAGPETALDAGPERFTAWWRGWSADHEPADLGVLAESLFDAWPSVPAELFDTCSPHRVEAVAAQIRDEYREDAGELLDLLPAWVTWLAERTGLPPELRDRSLSRLASPSVVDTYDRVIE